MPIANEITVEVFPNEITAGLTIQETQVVVAATGPQGIPGPPGPAGGASFEFIQSSPSNSWVIDHNLGRYPAVVVFVDEQPVEADIAYGSINQLTVSFLAPQVGRAEM